LVVVWIFDTVQGRSQWCRIATIRASTRPGIWKTWLSSNYVSLKCNWQ